MNQQLRVAGVSLVGALVIGATGGCSSDRNNDEKSQDGTSVVETESGAEDTSVEEAKVDVADYFERLVEAAVMDYDGEFRVPENVEEMGNPQKGLDPAMEKIQENLAHVSEMARAGATREDFIPDSDLEDGEIEHLFSDFYNLDNLFYASEVEEKRSIVCKFIRLRLMVQAKLAGQPAPNVQRPSEDQIEVSIGDPDSYYDTADVEYDSLFDLKNGQKSPISEDINNSLFSFGYIDDHGWRITPSEYFLAMTGDQESVLIHETGEIAVF